MPDDVEIDAGAAAPFDPILAKELDRPATSLSLYLEEASLYRPIGTGDIFRGVPVPGADESESGYDLTMVIAHPSAMRRGAELDQRARAAPVLPINGLSKSKWTPGHYDYFPLPSFREVASRNGHEVDARGWGACLQLAGPVATANLDVGNRVACLSPEGIHLLLQRLVHADTRVAVRIQTLAKIFAPKLDEMELLETWLEELAGPLINSGADRGRTLLLGAQEFESFLSAPRAAAGEAVRSLLEDPRRSGEARRIVMAEVRKRRPQL